jgi:hypothetical protein
MNSIDASIRPSYKYNLVLKSFSYLTQVIGHLYMYKGCFFKFGVEVGVGESIENAPLV